LPRKNCFRQFSAIYGNTRTKYFYLLFIGFHLHHQKKFSDLLLNVSQGLEQEGFFGKTTQAPKNGYEIWHLERSQPLQDTLIEDSGEGVGEVQAGHSGCTGGQMGEGGTERAEDCTYFMDRGMGIIS
jgi:hypothetical protein